MEAGGVSAAAWQRASLPLLMLRVLRSSPRHGYGISRALVDAGLQPITGAQLYPALVKLEADGAIGAAWEEGDSGPARKVYSLTARGRERLVELEDEWQSFVTAASRVV